MIDEFLNVLVRESNFSKYIFSFIRPAISASILLVIGALILSWIRVRENHWLVPLSPLIGFAAVVVFWSNLGLLFGARTPLFLGLTLLFGCIRIWKRREHLIPLYKKCGWALLIGFVVTIGFGNLPQSRVSDGRSLNHVTSNHDAIYYASNEAWVADHAYATRPQILETGPNSQDAPGKSSAVVASDFNVRQGDGLVAAFINSFVPSKYSYDWYAMRTTWLWLGFCSLLSAGMILKLRRNQATIAALLGVTSWQMVFQMYNQNAPAIIGLSVVSLLFALATSIRREENTDQVVIFSSAMSIAILITTYGELLPIAALVFIFAIASKKLFSSRIIRPLLIAAVSATISVPFASYQTFKTIIRVGGLANSLGAPQFWNRPALDALKDVFGIPQIESWGTPLLFIVLFLLLAGFITTSVSFRSPAPILVLGLLVLIWWRLGSQDAFYSLDRLVQTTVPIVIWIGAVGLLGWPYSKLRQVDLLRYSPCLILIINVIAPVHFLYISGKLDGRTFLTSLSRYSSKAISQSSEGNQLMIHTSNYIDRLWLTSITNRNNQVEYAFLTPDYFYGLTRYDDRLSDQSLLSNLKPVGSDIPVISQLAGSDYALYNLRNTDGALLVPARQDQTQNAGNEISGRGAVEFRVLCWTELSSISVKLEVVGAPENFQIYANDKLDRAVATNNLLSIQLQPGTNDIRIESPSQTPDTEWSVKLISITNEKATGK
jgi:hypothetical protein